MEDNLCHLLCIGQNSMPNTGRNLGPIWYVWSPLHAKRYPIHRIRDLDMYNVTLGMWLALSECLITNLLRLLSHLPSQSSTLMHVSISPGI